MDSQFRRIITANIRKGPDKYRGVCMSVLFFGKAPGLAIYIPNPLCELLPTFEGKSKFHIAEGLGPGENCLYLIPSEDGLVARRTPAKALIHLNISYLDQYKIFYPNNEPGVILSTQVDHEVINAEVKVSCPPWLRRVGA